MFLFHMTFKEAQSALNPPTLQACKETALDYELFYSYFNL